MQAAAVNRMLADEPWARERLARHAGRAFTLRVGPISAGFRIDDAGLLERAPLGGAIPDLALTVSPFNVPALLADPKRWNEFVVEDGDVELGGTLKELAQTLPLLVEKLSSRMLGPVVGQRVADAGRRVLGAPEHVASRVAANVGSYARDEAQLLAHPMDMRKLIDETASLASRIDALDARIGALAARGSGTLR